MNNKKMVRGALLVALALAMQSLRLVIPMPLPVSTFIIGTLVHMMLGLMLRFNGLTAAMLLGFLLPLTAYMQGQVAIVLLVPVIWLGNLLFVLVLHMLSGNNRMLKLMAAPLVKACVMTVCALGVVKIVALPNPAMRTTILFAMSIPQFVTAMLGILLARQVLLRLRKF